MPQLFTSRFRLHVFPNHVFRALDMHPAYTCTRRAFVTVFSSNPCPTDRQTCVASTPHFGRGTAHTACTAGPFLFRNRNHGFLMSATAVFKNERGGLYTPRQARKAHALGSLHFLLSCSISRICHEESSALIKAAGQKQMTCFCNSTCKKSSLRRLNQDILLISHSATATCLSATLPTEVAAPPTSLKQKAIL